MTTTFKIIKKYWDTQAEKEGHLKNATIKDWYLRDLEVEAVKRYFKKTDLVLDVGCGNGDPTLQYSHFVKKIIGTDYSEKMIEKAREKAKKMKIINVEFLYADARSLPFLDGTFDKVIISRVLINLPDVVSKEKIIREAARVLKKGGLCILLEATLQGHKNTNKIRRKFGLNDLKKHWHNAYVDEETMSEFIQKFFNIVSTYRFSTYMFISKLLYPLIIVPREPKFLSKFNKVAAEISKTIPEIGNCDIGHNLMWVLEKT